jgi:hypothetical protein
VEPASCKQCGFSFKKRTRLTTLGRCPVSKSEPISSPRFKVTIPKKREDIEKALGSIESSGQQGSDQRPDDPAEESDQWIQNAQIKKTDDDKKPIRLQTGEEILGSFRYESHQYL